MELGTPILLAFMAIYVARRGFERVFVLTSPALEQPGRQFLLEMILGLTAGAMVMGYNRQTYGFPFVSGFHLILGFVVFSFFSGMDMALHRERTLINEAIENEGPVPPGSLSSMTRRFTLVAVATAIFIVVVLFLIISKDLAWLSGQNRLSVTEAQRSVAIEIVFVMAVLLGLVVNLVLSYSKNLKILFENETAVLEKVARGDLSQLVPVATRDEFGVIADYTNAMIHGLRHRLSLMTGLKVAKEVQQSLLPKAAPLFSGLDVAGVSQYCEETGGDYFDYFILSQNRFAAIVADASDHGVGSALYMAMARAFITSHIRETGDPAQMMEQVNVFLVKDSAETGRFITAFLLEIDTDQRFIQWVRAGHDPAFFYDGATGGFEMLTGKGMAMGVDPRAAYHTRNRQGWSAGSILLIGTDGIWETRNTENRFFGKRRLREIIRGHANQNAEAIRDAVIEAVTEFRGPSPLEDDITLVVVKFA